MTTLNFPRSMFVGFDQLFDQIERQQDTPKYPPYNIKKESDSTFSIDIAVAGFALDELSVFKEKNQLIVRGDAKEDTSEYIHKGISSKSFKRTFTLADQVEVGCVDLEDGILSIKLNRVIPPEDTPKRIQINSRGDYNPDTSVFIQE